MFSFHSPNAISQPIEISSSILLSNSGFDGTYGWIARGDRRIACSWPAVGATLSEMEQAVPILPAEDLAAAKTFYVDGLGFQVRFQSSEDGRKGLLGLERGGIQLTIDSPMEGHGRNACVSLQVDDADAYYREWSAKVTVLRAPLDEEWGARTFDLLDPSGNTIFFMGPVSGKRE